jgi:hypothetical protein
MQILLSIVGFLLGGSFLGFIEFLIHRKDEHNKRYDELTKSIKDLAARLDRMEAKGDEREAVHSRIRILRFGDEVRQGMAHSKDSFDQCLIDTDLYENFCAANPNFLNNKTATTVEYIKRVYAERLEKNDFV